MENAAEKFIFVVYHHPSLSVHPSYSWEEKKEFQNRIRPLLFNYQNKITAVLNGHVHMASLLKFNSLPIVVAGAGVDLVPPKPVDNNQQRIHVSTQWIYNEMSPHWVKLFIDDSAKNQAKLEFIKAQTDERVFSIEFSPLSHRSPIGLNAAASGKITRRGEER